MADVNYTLKNKTSSTWENAPLKLKICGMKLNTAQVAALQPDYLGFIFWENSKRNFEGSLEVLPHSIKKVGVFVNATHADIKEKVITYDLTAVQLHGEESPLFCAELKAQLNSVSLIKVFRMQEAFDFELLLPYENLVDFYLFDTKGKLPGGNGYTFNWNVLNAYPSKKPYFLSGGIGLGEVHQLESFLKTPVSKYCHAIDVNSKFEIAPGLKNIEKLKELKKILCI